MLTAIKRSHFIGHAGANAEFQEYPNGVSIAKFSLAEGYKYTDKDTGEQKTVTRWHKVVLFDKLAQNARDYVKKGSKVFVKTQAQPVEFDKDGVKHQRGHYHPLF